MRKAYPPLARSILWSPCGQSFRLLDTADAPRTHGMALFVEQCALAAATAHAHSTEPDTAVGLLLGHRYQSRSDSSRFDIVEAIIPAATIPESADMHLDELLATLRASAPLRGREPLGWYCSPLPTDRALSSELETAHLKQFGESGPWVLAIDRAYGATTQGMFFAVDPHDRRSCRAPFCESFPKPAPAFDPVWLSCAVWDGYWTRDMVLPLDGTAREALVKEGVHGGGGGGARRPLLRRVLGRGPGAGDATSSLFPSTTLGGAFPRTRAAEPAAGRGETVVPREVAREMPRGPRGEPPREVASVPPPPERAREASRDETPGVAREAPEQAASAPPRPAAGEPAHVVASPVVADDRAPSRAGDMHTVARRRLFELTGTELREPEPQKQALPVPRGHARSALELPSRLREREPAPPPEPPLVTAARREGFEHVAQFRPTMRSAHPESLWVLHSPELCALLEVLVVDDAVADASIHYNLRAADPRELADAFAQHRDMATRTIYRRESCAAGVDDVCRRLRERDTPGAPWTVSPQLYLLTPGEWTHFAATARTGRDAAASVYELALQRIGSLPDAVRRQLGAALAALAPPGGETSGGETSPVDVPAVVADAPSDVAAPDAGATPLAPDVGVTSEAR